MIDLIPADSSCGVDRLRWERTDFDSVSAHVSVDVAEAFAIAIGPGSHFDRCTVFPQRALQPPKASALATETARTALPLGIDVSVERPWLGYLKGPFDILLPYGRATCSGGDRIHPQSNTVWGLYTGSEVFQAALELHFFRSMPPWLPTKRAPLDHVFRYDQFGTTGIPTNRVIRFPTYGRRHHSLSIEMTGRSAGDITWILQGVNESVSQGGTGSVNIAHVIQPTTTEAVDFERTYYFDGEFDRLTLTIAEGTALAAGTTIQGFYKGWD